MNKNLLVAAGLVVLALPAQATEPLPGAACNAANNLQFTSGPEVAGGGGHVLLCQGGTWKSILSFNNVAGVTKFGNLACTNGQILKFNGTSWTCAADSGGTLPGLSSAQIWVGNASNAAGAVTMSGDATLSNAGVLAIAGNAIGSAEISDGTVANADLAGSIALTKLSITGTANSSVFLRGDGTWAAPPSGADNLGNHTATTSLTMANNAIVNAGQISTGPWNATYDIWYQGGPNGASGSARNLAILGTDNDSGDTLYINHSSEYSGGTIIGGTVSISNGLSLLSGNLSLGSGALTSSAGTVIDGAGGWHRTYGNTGWYNGTHGGGWTMEDSTWLRAYGGKGVYTTNVVRADSGVRTNQVCDVSGGNCIAQGALGGSGGGVTATANASCSVNSVGGATCSATCPSGYYAASGVVVANSDKFPCMGSTAATANSDCWFSSDTAVSIQNAGWGAVARTLHVRCLK